MSIWFRPYTLEEINSKNRCMANHLAINFVEIGDDYLKATMPVDERTQQPYGLLHGGASCVLAETIGSVATVMCIDDSKQRAAGIEINASHLRGVSSGLVTGTARPIRIGRTTQVWDIRITDEQERLVCISRLTMAVM